MQLYIFILIILFILMTTLIGYKTDSNKLKTWILNSFGKKPQKTDYDYDKINIFWKEFNADIPENKKIDTITWNDLDMDMIFNRINTCSSFAGEQVLYSNLHCSSGMFEYNKLEKMVDYFTNHEKKRSTIQVLLCKLGKAEMSYYLPNFLSNLESFKLKGNYIYRFLQILLLLPILGYIFSHNSLFLFITMIVFLFNILLYARLKIQCEIYLNSFDSIIRIIKISRKIIKTQGYILEGDLPILKSRADALKKISLMVGKIQNKKNAGLTGDIMGLLYDYIIGATLLDFTSYNKVIKLLTGKQNEFMDLYRMLGMLDMAISISSFRCSLPHFCIPVFCDECRLAVQDLYHPLIDMPVCNSLDLDKSCIITGSNASGKSTFIKAISVNTILAQSINTCMASKMVLPDAHVITSMAVRDDLMTGESYYIKEIKSLNRIIQSLNRNRMVVCAIDEILKGTNAEERIAASASILKFLEGKNCLAIVATHDIELVKLLETSYANYHFKEQILDNDITFDYKIRVGAVISKNAIKLLELTEFPKEIIINARKLINGS